jgi:hypothetical protein
LTELLIDHLTSTIEELKNTGEFNFCAGRDRNSGRHFSKVFKNAKTFHDNRLQDKLHVRHGLTRPSTGLSKTIS